MSTERAPANHWRQVHKRANEHLLFAEDLGPVGTKVNVEVDASGVMTVKGSDGSKPMPWIGFKGKSKRLGLNATNCKVMETLCGTPDYAKWRGPITLVVIRTRYTDTASKQRIETDAIRIASERPSGSRQDRPRDANEPDAAERAEIERREAGENNR